METRKVDDTIWIDADRTIEDVDKTFSLDPREFIVDRYTRTVYQRKDGAL